MNAMQEQSGYGAVQQLCSDMDAFWRPTLMGDLGIDGQIEFLEHEQAVSTGKIMAVQVKSGPSYFKHSNNEAIFFYPKATHRKYWDRLDLPVLLVLHHPDDKTTYYARVKHQLQLGGPICVPHSQVLCGAAREHLLSFIEEDQKLLLQRFDPEKVLTAFRNITLPSPDDFEINGLHFLLACVSPKIRHYEILIDRIQFGFKVIDPSFDAGRLLHNGLKDFILRCVMKCWAYNLTEDFVDSFEFEWYELQKMPEVSAPLTVYGKALMNHLWNGIGEYLQTSDRNSIDLARQISEAAQEASERHDDKENLTFWPL